MSTEARLSSPSRESRSGPVSLEGSAYLRARVTVALLLAVPVGVLTASLLAGAARAETAAPLAMLSVPAVALAWGVFCFFVAREVEEDSSRAVEAALSGATVVLGAWLMTFFSFFNG